MIVKVTLVAEFSDIGQTDDVSNIAEAMEEARRFMLGAGGKVTVAKLECLEEPPTCQACGSYTLNQHASGCSSNKTGEGA